MKAIGKQYNTCKTKQGQIKETIKERPLNFCPRPPRMQVLLIVITRLISFDILLY